MDDYVDMPIYYTGSMTKRVVLPGQGYVAHPSKHYLTSYVYSTTFALGYGFVEYQGEELPTRRLSYARIDGVEVGTPTLEHLTEVAAEGDAVPAAFALGVYPNPVADRATLRLTLPQPTEAAVEVYDVLGRRVLRQAAGLLGAGTRPIALDARAWAAGTYLVRVRTEAGAVATVRVTKR